MQQYSAKEKHLVANTLNCVPYLLQGYSVLIDLRNETSVAGIIDSSDGFMNIHLANAVYIDRNGLQYPFEQFMVRERMIRQIHIPAAVDIEQMVREWMEHGLRRKSVHPLKSRKQKPTFKMKRAKQRHEEILQQIESKK